MPSVLYIPFKHLQQTRLIDLLQNGFYKLQAEQLWCKIEYLPTDTKKPGRCPAFLSAPK
jgi:hypothetical protein